ncbi:FecR family protein [Steroidobacter flavus]|uniref:FecR family protein n=1 Tax=Steroidobacter flavus TaxID=1842136 RepID=A0ABV8SNL1_9GAMM
MSETELDVIAQRWVVRLASQDIRDEELHAFETWLAGSSAHREAFDRARRTWSRLGDVFTEERPKIKQTVALRLAAAVAALAVGLAFVIDGTPPDVASVVGEVKSTMLPDGSMAVLDSGSAIEVEFTAAERRIRLLRGSAWFDVKRNPDVLFVVEANDVRAVAKGTAYAVTRLDDGAIVQVTHGRVEVNVRGDALTLAAGEKLTASSEAVTREPGSDSAVAWHRGRIEIENASLQDALAIIDRYRRGMILSLGSLPDKKVNLAIDVDESERGLESLVQAQGLRTIALTPWLTLVMRP